MQRIKWWQDVVRRPLRNLQLLGTMFGVSTWEEQEVRFVDREGFRIGPEYEWWKQFLEDVGELFRVGECFELLARVRERP
eukprot:4130294-Pyramimonas_sp.AAC.1